MKATGVIRRLDDLGRIVIPKEIRKLMRIREGEPMEIFVNAEGDIILKKYSPIGDLSEFAMQYAEAISQNIGKVVCITDRDQIIAVAGGNRKELLKQPIGRELELAMEQRSIIEGKQQNLFNGYLEAGDFKQEIVVPILSAGDVIGVVAVLGKDEKDWNGEVEKKLASTAASFLGKQMEI